jgi:hypothetical protein
VRRWISLKIFILYQLLEFDRQNDWFRKANEDLKPDREQTDDILGSLRDTLRQLITFLPHILLASTEVIDSERQDSSTLPYFDWLFSSRNYSSLSTTLLFLFNKRWPTTRTKTTLPSCRWPFCGSVIRSRDQWMIHLQNTYILWAFFLPVWFLENPLILSV